MRAAMFIWKLFYLFLSDFPAVGDEETEEARAAAELYTTVLQHTGRYKHFIISPLISFNNPNCPVFHLVQHCVLVFSSFCVRTGNLKNKNNIKSDFFLSDALKEPFFTFCWSVCSLDWFQICPAALWCREWRWELNPSCAVLLCFSVVSQEYVLQRTFLVHLVHQTANVASFSSTTSEALSTQADVFCYR